jgi:hypothetical protein
MGLGALFRGVTYVVTKLIYPLYILYIGGYKKKKSVNRTSFYEKITQKKGTENKHWMLEKRNYSSCQDL